MAFMQIARALAEIMILEGDTQQTVIQLKTWTKSLLGKKRGFEGEIDLFLFLLESGLFFIFFNTEKQYLRPVFVVKVLRL